MTYGSEEAENNRIYTYNRVRNRFPFASYAVHARTCHGQSNKNNRTRGAAAAAAAAAVARRIRNRRDRIQGRLDILSAI